MALTLTGANQKTEWFDLTGAASEIMFHLTGDFSEAVGIHYSNEKAYDKEDAYLVGAASDIWPVTTADGPFELPFGIALYVRFYSGASWGAGTTCTPLFGNKKGADGQLTEIQVQDRYAP